VNSAGGQLHKSKEKWGLLIKVLTEEGEQLEGEGPLKVIGAGQTQTFGRDWESEETSIGRGGNRGKRKKRPTRAAIEFPHI